MCLIAFALNASARWPLVIAANRDEFWHRPTLPLQRWTTPNGAEVFSGRDLQAGGTWMGVTAAGRVAMLTNVREAQQVAAPRSRGDLPLDWLGGNGTAREFVERLKADGAEHHYGGFNLVIGDARQDQWLWVSNRRASGQGAGQLQPGWQSRALQPGIYGLSNAFLDTPWPKTQALKTALAQSLQAQHEDDLVSPLWAALAHKGQATEEALPETGVPRDWEQALSSAFVSYPERGYGTRCSTLLVMQGHDAVRGGRPVQVYEKSTAPLGAIGADSLAAKTLLF